MREKLTKAHYDFLRRVRDDLPLGVADRPEDRVRQRCRREGLAEVAKNPRRWVITEAGCAALSEERGEQGLDKVREGSHSAEPPSDGGVS